MRRLGLALLAATVASGLPAVAADRTPVAESQIDLLARFEHDPAAAVITDGSATRLLRLGDLDGDGIDDAGLVRARPRSGPPGVGDDLLTVAAISGADGGTIWGPFAYARGTRLDIANSETPLDPPALVAAGWFFDGDAIGDLVVAVTDPGGQSLVEARAGADGRTLWRIERPFLLGDGAPAGTLLPLTTREDDPYGRRLLLGRMSGGAAAWTLETLLVSPEGEIEQTATATGIGMRPAATLAQLTQSPDADLVLANPVRTPAGVTVIVQAHSAASSLPVPGARTITAPAQEGDAGISLRALRGEAGQAGGLLVGIDRADPAVNGWARQTGPSRLIGLGRGGLERFRITLPAAATIGWVGDLDGDDLQDLRTARVDRDSIVVETWAAHGENPLLASHRMTMLEADDYERIVDVRPDLGDVDGDGRAEWLIGAGYPCGPRYQVVGADGARWERGEIRALGCFGRLAPAGLSLDADERLDVLDWTTHWTCCFPFGPLPSGVSVDARRGSDGTQLWSTALPDLTVTDSLERVALGDRLAIVAGGLSRRMAYGLDADTGSILWSLDVT